MKNVFQITIITIRLINLEKVHQHYSSELISFIKQICGVPGLTKPADNLLGNNIKIQGGLYRSVVLTGEFLLQKW